MLKKVVLSVLCLLMASAIFAQDTVTETSGQFTVTFPSTFTLQMTGDNSFILDNGTDNTINFATSVELEAAFGITAETAEEGFPLLIERLVSFGATRADDGITELEINGQPAPLQKLNPPPGESGGAIYFGTMVLTDGSWGLIGFSPIFETEVELLQGVYNSIVIGAVQETEANLFAITEALTPAEMPEGFYIMLSSFGNLVFEVPEGANPLDTTVILDSASFLVGTGSTITVFTLDTGFATLDVFLNSYVETIAATAGDTAFDVTTSIIKTENEDGSVRYDYTSPERGVLYARVVVVGINESAGVVIQSIGLGAEQEAIDEATDKIFTTFEIVERGEAVATEEAVATDSAVASPVAGAEEATCFSRGYDFVDSTAEAVINCPANCDTDNSSTVWGTDIYTDDSGVCVAAVHAGVISLAGGGVKVTAEVGQDAYTGSARNGVTTSNYGAWSGSFTVDKP